ncbi:LPS-assembly protein LptD [Catenovulum sediminis]|uniref:LPS-assembly protein LptD n=1 Tax=Catenovulum sediminis TaxID=1740262 RepID=A0ABV1RK06_9ALTE|nr:LPS assembly protein LptD [Catenovulum sediminis]
MIRFIAAFCGLVSVSVSAAQQQCYEAFSDGQKSDTKVVKTDNVDVENQFIILSDKTEVGVDTAARFSGQVSIIQGANRIQADSARVSSNREKMTAAGGIKFVSEHATVQSDSLVADITNSSLTLNQSNYQLDNFAGHGKAGVFQINHEQKNIQLEDATYTNCPPQNAPDWQLKAEKITLSVQDEWGEAWHSRLEIFEVPVLYLPYFSFPLSDKRKSGWLYPSISTSSQRGADIAAPYYWNIAENMDLTVTPRIMSKRGSQFGSEFRYLQEDYQGSLHFQWMPEDKEFYESGSSLNESSDERSAIHWLHQSAFLNDWQANVDLIFISDDSYVSDLGFEQLSGVDTHVERHIELSRYSDNWSVNVTLRDFEVFGQHAKPYRTLPEIEFWYGGLTELDNWSFDVPAQFAWFQSDEIGLAEAVRTHIEPKLTWSKYAPAWEVSAQTAFPMTYYFQEESDENGQLREGHYQGIGRALPRFRLNGRLILERPIDWFGRDMKQTLEPRAQYLLVPYRNQSKIGLYDTALLQDDYLGLFRENRFSGIDRIPEANQITLGITTRLLNDLNREKLRLSVGQIIYLEESGTDFVDYRQTTIKGESALALELDFDIRKTWFLHYGLQFDAQKGDTRKSQFTIDYRKDDAHLMQFSHRFVRDISGNNIQQLGITSMWELNEQWQTYANFHYDLKLNRTVEARAGLLYQSCCWELQFGWQSKVKTNLAASDSQTSVPTNERDSGMLLSFTIRGFGPSKNRSDKVLNGGLFGYRKPYFLNQ